MQSLKRRKANPSGRDADPRRTLPLNGAAWQKLRAYILRESPLCEHCAVLGHVVPATDVDHVDGNPGNNSMANLQSLCHACHSHKTMRERHGLEARMGCDAKGMPLDPSHHWNSAPGATQGPSRAEKSPATKRSRPAAQSFLNANRKDRP